MLDAALYLWEIEIILLVDEHKPILMQCSQSTIDSILGMWRMLPYFGMPGGSSRSPFAKDC